MPDEHHPSVAELAPYVPFPLPPRLASGEDEGSFRGRRHAAWRGAWACYLENAGWSWPEIAKELGFASGERARLAANKHTEVYGEQAAIQRRSEMRERIGRLRDWTWEHIAEPPYKFTVTGQQVRNPDGTPALDEDIRIRYLDVALKLEERQAKLDGSDARDAQKIEAGDLDYTMQITDLVTRIKSAIIAGKPVAELEAGHDSGQTEDPPAR